MINLKNRSIQRLNFILIPVFILLSGGVNLEVAIAQKQKQPEPEKPLLDDFSPNPLFTKEPDP